jgi:nucleoside-diphosphate-sugar epimerase
MTDAHQPPFLFCFGLGYTAQALARALAPEGWRVAGTSRSDEGAAALRRAGWTAFGFSRETALDPACFAGATHILVSVPPDAAGDPVLDVMGEALADRHPAWLGYLSTTGVYGDRGGGWVDEGSDLLPAGERGRRRVAAETGWLDLMRRRGTPVHLFRLAGIYGPGRSALDQLRAGTAKRIDKPGQLFSRIHVADIVAVLRASMARPNPGAAYNVGDDEPAPPQEVVAHAAALLGLPPPPLEPFDAERLSPMAASFYGESKRVANHRIKQELGVRLAFPTYREGLAALLAEGPR